MSSTELTLASKDMTQHSFLPLGFDLRKTQEPDAWPDHRRELYLLKNTPCIRSIDTNVWPSAAHTTGFVGYFQHFWLDSKALEEYRRHQLKSIASLTMIEACVLKETHSGFTEAWKTIINSLPQNEPTAPATLSKTFLGYDVADRWGTSGLSNCGYSENEAMPLKTRFSSALNDDHLFSDIDYALEFKKMTETRVKEHAPFFVYALWKIDPI